MTTQPSGTEQARLWNGPSGHTWVDMQATLDHLFQPFEDLLVEAVADAGAHHVLDVGCGTGATTLAISRSARSQGAEGRSTGIDISQPMIATARSRAERQGTQSTSFVCADVQAHAFEAGAFDMLVSRFGVMFFDDPVRAFSNLRRAATDHASLKFIAWRSAAENPFMTTAERAAAPLLDLPARQPGAPGQFAFAERQHVLGILQQSGWQDIDIAPIDVPCTLPEKDLRGYLSRLGPVGMKLRSADERTREKVIDTVRAAFDPFVHGNEVRFTAACWSIGARAGKGAA
ncbi:MULTISPECIES: class I SAM-dependent methyltransferase [unclassified Variovorax]|uniref:class I SAM-dependent methyltransferase n=1 Tax=unclassified Variovorax TaxID=663243 RepID=UPI003F44988D